MTEIVALFGLVPLALLITSAPRWAIHVCLWFFTLYALYHLRRAPAFSWRRLWEGEGWPKDLKRSAVFRFLLLTPIMTALTLYLVPERFFRFPIERPVFWVAVMVLYPLLSVVPQEIMFRSFFFERYQSLLPRQGMMIAASAFVFGLGHIMFHNWVSPTLSLIGGLIFASSFACHRSLKWAALEHAAYGCFIFTLGLGWFFFAH